MCLQVMYYIQKILIENIAASLIFLYLEDCLKNVCVCWIFNEIDQRHFLAPCSVQRIIILLKQPLYIATHFKLLNNQTNLSNI
jgi:hypothetical protein